MSKIVHCFGFDWNLKVVKISKYYTHLLHKEIENCEYIKHQPWNLIYWSPFAKDIIWNIYYKLCDSCCPGEMRGNRDSLYETNINFRFISKALHSILFIEHSKFESVNRLYRQNFNRLFFSTMCRQNVFQIIRYMKTQDSQGSLRNEQIQDQLSCYITIWPSISQ